MTIAPGEDILASDMDELMPVGTVLSFAGSSAPTGFLACDGAAVSRATYADLFAVISTTYGVGDGSTTFNVPDMRGSHPIGDGTKSATRTASFTNSGVDISADTITFTTPHGFNNGDQFSFATTGTLLSLIGTSASGSVSIDASGNIGKGSNTLPQVGEAIKINSQSSTDLGTGQIYYVITRDTGTNTFTVSSTPGGSIAGSGNAGTLEWLAQASASSLNSNTYYVIRISELVIQFATSLANALAGTNENIVNAGSGTSSISKSVTLTTRARGEWGGEEKHYLSIPELPSHIHGSDLMKTSGGGSSLTGSGGSSDQFTNTDPTGGDDPHNVMNPFVVTKYIIRYLSYA